MAAGTRSQTGEFRIVVATDGSPSARAALETAAAFPWPEPSRARGVIALGGWPRMGISLRAEARRRLYAQSDPVKHRLARRWRDASVIALHEPPVDAIFSEARRFGADAAVLGWRGHGAFRRLLAGSVSREVVARARIPVLVARTGLDKVRRLVVGFDGSPGSREALRFASRLEPSPGTVMIVANVVEPLALPPAVHRLPASIRHSMRTEVASLNRERLLKARDKTRAAAAVVGRGGWRPKVDVRYGFPLDTLLDAAEKRKGTVLIVGARAKRGLEGVLLGSVAEGALNSARVPVLIVR